MLTANLSALTKSPQWLEVFCTLQLISIGSSETETSELIVIAPIVLSLRTSETIATPVAKRPITLRKARLLAAAAGSAVGRSGNRELR